MELDKMIISKTAHKIFDLMISNKIMEEIMNVEDLDLKLLSQMDGNANLKYASFLHNIPDLKELLVGLRFSNSDIKEISALSHFRNFYGDLSKANNLNMIFYPLWIDMKELDGYVAISEVASNPTFQEIHQKILSPPPKFPLDGNDITKLGIKGADIATTIEALKLKWIESDFKLGKADLLQSKILG